MRITLRLLFSAVPLFACLNATVARADPVIATHPRLLLAAADRSRLFAKKNANDPSWQALKARADTLATYTIYPYKFATRSTEPAGTIFYDYQGQGWYDAALPLAFAYQMTGDTAYSNKLIQVAQEMIRAQSDPDNNPPIGLPPLQPDNYYPARNLASTLGFIYDHCYDQLSASLKGQMVALMNQYFDDVRVNGYQAQIYSSAADGNFFGGHLYGVALMGYASFGDNPRAQEMIDWARIRFDGTRGSSLSSSEIPLAWRTQVFDGGLRPPVALDYLGPAITGNPFKGGFDFQAWSYGSEEFSRQIDYMLIVRSATGEDILTPHIDWYSQILRAEKHALFPNRFMIDPTGDWGGFQGAVISRGLPTRLAFVLAGTPDGPGAQHLAGAGITASTIPGAQVYPAEEWAEFFFADSSRPSREIVLPPYYTGFAPNYPQGASSPGGTNGAIPYFIMRSDWGANATWASVKMGNQVWDDHQHWGAGHLIVSRGGDYLLVSAGDWKTALGPMGTPIHGGPGILGNSSQQDESSLANTLYFDDFGEFQRTDASASGGQSYQGVDHVIADELNQDFSYVRSDLSTAYNRLADPADTPNRKLDFFYRNFLYLRAPNVFVIYDQVQAKTSANSRGAYKKHIRWHLPNTPTITGTMARLDHGQSRLFLDVLLPVNASLAVVDELTNPDPCDGSVPGCVPFGQTNAGTYRIEVRDPLNPLFIPFLTVLQPGSNTSTAPTDTQVASLDGKMIGVVISQAGGARSIALFNNQAGQVPAPIASTSYTFPGSGLVSHTLMGLVPGALYSVVLTNGVVDVNQSAGGDKTASSSGVLRFILSSSSPVADLTVTKTHASNFTQGQTGATYTITVTNAGGAPTSGTVTLTDTLPASLTATALGGSGWTCTLGTLSCTRGDGLAPSASYPAVTLTVTVASNAPPSVTNTASVAGGGEINTGNNSASDPTTVNGSGPIAPTMTTQPASQTIVAGQTVQFTVAASGTPAPTYQWQVSTTSGTTWTNLSNSSPYSGVTTGTLTIAAVPSSLSGAQYRAVATNSVGTATSNAATLTITQPGSGPTMALDRTALTFAAVTTGAAFSAQTAAQTVRLTQTGAGTVPWTAASTTPWLVVSPASGTGSATLTIAAQFASGLTASQTGRITLTFTGAGNSAGPITVTLTIVSSTAAVSPPFGVFDTPVGDASVLAGSIAVTGWTLDNIGVQRVELWRDLQPGETTPPFASTPSDPRNGKIFIANATFVDGARPDVEGLYPTMPVNYRAGWGYLLLTWGLWNQGNGTYKLYAYGFDQENNLGTIGTKTVIVSNNAATKPFGSIDTPAIGGEASGPNFGWGLTPKVGGVATCKIQPSGVQVSIDSGPLQPVVYGADVRSDIAGAFTGFSNSAAAGGHYIVDWTTLTTGAHTIGWLITDDCNRADGVGSRFFNVSTGTRLTASSVVSGFSRTAESRTNEPESTEPITVARGYGELPEIVTPGEAGSRTVAVKQGERIEIRVPRGFESAYQLVNAGQWRALPTGATWDAASGTFYWQPAAGFLGRYRIVFSNGRERINVRVVVTPSDVIDGRSPGG